MKLAKKFPFDARSLFLLAAIGLAVGASTSSAVLYSRNRTLSDQNEAYAERAALLQLAADHAFFFNEVVRDRGAVVAGTGDRQVPFEVIRSSVDLPEFVDGRLAGQPLCFSVERIFDNQWAVVTLVPKARQLAGVRLPAIDQEFPGTGFAFSGRTTTDDGKSFQLVFKSRAGTSVQIPDSRRPECDVEDRSFALVSFVDLRAGDLIQRPTTPASTAQ